MELDMHKEITNEQILKFKPLVKNIAYKFINSGEPLEDLEQLGYIGLINALNLYNQQRKVKFETYASWFISGEIRHYIRDKHQTIRIPHWIVELNRKIDEYMVNYKEETNQIPSLKKIAEEFNLTEEGVKEVLKARDVVHTVSIDQENRGYDCNEYPVLEKIKNDHYKSFKLPIEDLIALELALNKLQNLQRKVINYIFIKGMNQTKTAKKLAISQRQVSRIKNKALQSLKEELESDTT
ncbi:sigma-70 family RNA polymerase sigma factor [bacterium]|nr:sigma-70 family RNA polymerase sigma factor [bacterium]MBU4362386.1 sigma-70 family RNA polymerase sigma factor [bacterium]MBU4602440.1 sigma-70 family RNA polymerase sigma factor [bacterium]MCG2820385.1 sigma-70 family RNA polymerase sigma factor [Candidatus Atribacteria bacterium]